MSRVDDGAQMLARRDGVGVTGAVVVGVRASA
jgi:hypothetical protein